MDTLNGQTFTPLSVLLVRFFLILLKLVATFFFFHFFGFSSVLLLPCFQFSHINKIIFIKSFPLYLCFILWAAFLKKIKML